MNLLSLRHPESAMDVVAVATLEVVVLTGNYMLNGFGPAPLAVIAVVVALTGWILWADYRIIKHDGLFPNATVTYDPVTGEKRDEPRSERRQ
ncbi:hypothetical protein OB955_24820 [Halobacteria archaeon AArc-m2/3/4]|uniref:Uncharacterized protein n=1 Tax=Natronoglomus mannanivorans TaxID=2979990 RepID=A0ABT2QLU1_9EURY|nr:hypothetical protein [Halobacteria archaeon AArc-m2/3/4]